MADELVPTEDGDELEEIVFKRNKRPSLDQKDSYLELLTEGVPHVSAARKVGSTATAFRALRNREVHFRKLCERAEVEAPSAREDQVRAAMWDFILDKKHPRHWEAVKFAAEIYLQETEYKRIRQVRQQINMEAALAATLQISIEALRSMPDGDLDGLIGTLEQLEVTPRLSIVE